MYVQAVRSLWKTERARVTSTPDISTLYLSAPREGGLRGIRNTLTAPAGMHYRCSRLRLEGAVVGRGNAAPGKNSPLVKAIAFTALYFKRADAMHARDSSDVYRFVCLRLYKIIKENY